MKLYWTDHAKIKMRQYGLSKSKLTQLLYKPERKERGIAEGTTAVMQTRKVFLFKKAAVEKKSVFGFRPNQPPGEIWLMYKDVKMPAQGPEKVRKIISAWRYPGVSKPGEAVPMPEDIRKYLSE